MNDADARRQTSPRRCLQPTVTGALLGVAMQSDVTQSAVQFIQCHLSCKLDNGYVKILPPN
jgi:hypothetical protein